MGWTLCCTTGLLLFFPFVHLLNQEEEERLPLAQIKETEVSGPMVAEYIWPIRDIGQLLQSKGDPFQGPEFYTGRPGYKVRLSLTTGQVNPADGLPYIGIWFSLAPGIYDEVLEWPFPYALNLTLVDRRKQHRTIKPEVPDYDNSGSQLLGRHFPNDKQPSSDHRLQVPEHEYQLQDSQGRQIPFPSHSDRGQPDYRLPSSGLPDARIHGYKLSDQEISVIKSSKDHTTDSRLPNNHIPDTRFPNNPIPGSEYRTQGISEPGFQDSGQRNQGLPAHGFPGSETRHQGNSDTPYLDSASSIQENPISGFQHTNPRTQGRVLLDPRTQEHDLPNSRRQGHALPDPRTPKNVFPDPRTQGHTLPDPRFAGQGNSAARVPNIYLPDTKIEDHKTIDSLLPDHQKGISDTRLLEPQQSNPELIDTTPPHLLPALQETYSRPHPSPLQVEDASIHLTMNPTSAPCRLRKQFLRPRNKRRGSGCGKAYFVPRHRLLEYAHEDEIVVKVTIFLQRRVPTPKRAKVLMRGHQLVSEFLWNVNGVSSKRDDGRQVASDLFFVNSESYLLVLQMSFNAKDEVGLFVTLVPGEFDDTLQWPFAYNFELVVTDSVGNERRGSIDPTSGTCPLQAFTRPRQRPNPPCGFRKLAGLAKNGSLVVKFSAVLDQMPHFAKLAARDGFLVAEYVWRVPNIERKMQLARSDRLSNLLSERFYSQPQGYLMQLQLKFQKNATAGIFLTLLEGAYDHLLSWPFGWRFQLRVVDQQEGVGGEDLVVEVDPSDPYVQGEACSGSFWRPFGRNDACGSSSAATYDQLYDRKFIRYGAILLKVVLFLQEIRPPRFASLMVRDHSLVARFEWRVPDIEAKIRQSKEGHLPFLDSEKFYVANNGYRMMLRLYPEKAAGFAGLYAVLVRGAYDDELEWPFPHTFRLEVDYGNGKTISRTTHPGTSGSGCPDVAFKRPDRELAEWSCGEGRMVAHQTLLGEFSATAIRPSYEDAVGRFAVEIVLDELENPPIGALRIDPHGGALVSRYSWIMRGTADALSLLNSGEKETLESPVFYTENQGYAIRLSLSFGRKRHDPAFKDDIGLYWTLQKGRHDDALSWPFKGPVTLSIVDRNGVKHLEGIPGPELGKCPPGAFDKPKESYNKQSCGFPALMTLSTLISFTYDGILHIQASVALT